MLEATDLVKIYGHGDGAVRALNHIGLSIARGQFTAIMGPSGSGKSTLMHCLAGLDTITSGSVVLDGYHLSEMSERQLTRLRREKIGFIFQSFNLVPTLSARENILLPMDIAKRKVSADRFHQVVSAVGLGDRLTHYPAELSGGQQQRVACARALVGSPAVVFADEPTGNLDSQATVQVLRFLRKAVDEFQQTVVMVTHEADAAAWADRVVFIKDGAIAMELQRPTRDSVLEALRELGNVDEETAAEAARVSPEPSNIDADAKSGIATGVPAGVTELGAIPLSGAIPGVATGVISGSVNGVSSSGVSDGVSAGGVTNGVATGEEALPAAGMAPGTGAFPAVGVNAGVAMGAHPITGEIPQIEDDAFVSVNFPEDPLVSATDGVDYTQLAQMPLGELPNQDHTHLTTPTVPAPLTAPTDASMNNPVSSGMPTVAASDPFIDTSGTVFTGAGSMPGVSEPSGVTGTGGAARPDETARTGAFPKLGAAGDSAATTGMAGATSTGFPEETAAPAAGVIQPDLNISGMPQANAIFVDPVEPQTQIIDLNAAGDQLWRQIPMDSRERASARGAHYAAAHAYPNVSADYLTEQFLSTTSAEIPVGEVQPEQISEGHISQEQRQVIDHAQEILEHLPGSVMEQNERRTQ